MSDDGALRRLAARARLAIGRVVLNLVDDAAKLQALQVTVRAGEVRDRAERFQQYGFTSVPLPGAEGIGLAVGGSTDHMVVICVDDRRYRMRGLEGGEVAIYDMHGNHVHLKADEIVVHHATKVTVDAPLVHCTGDVTVAGDVVAGTVSLRHHVHGGVTPGGGATGQPL